MNKLIAVFSIVFLSLTASAQSDPIMFTGKLISVPTSAADCGTMAIAAVYEFEVTMIGDQNYTAANIPVVVRCPELLGADFFKVGANYKMELFDTNNGTSYSIINDSVLANYTLAHNYWAGDIVRR